MAPSASRKKETMSRPIVIAGQVRGLNVGRTRWLEFYVVRFWIARWNAAGQPLLAVPVVMQGPSFDGTLDVGDWVGLVSPSWTAGQVVEAQSIGNATTGVPFTRRSIWRTPPQPGRGMTDHRNPFSIASPVSIRCPIGPNYDGRHWR
jgi:hypothetical protein